MKLSKSAVLGRDLVPFSDVFGLQRALPWNLSYTFMLSCMRHGGLIVSALDSGSSGPGSSPGRGTANYVLGQDTLPS